MSSRLKALLVTVAFLAIGCDLSDDPTRANYGRLLVQKELPAGSAMMAAQIRGNIQIDSNDCVLVDFGSQLIALMWPSGTTYDGDRHAVLLGDGRLIRDGDLVSLGGGEVLLDGNRSLIEPASITSAAEACVDLAHDRTKIWIIGVVE